MRPTHPLMKSLTFLLLMTLFAAACSSDTSSSSSDLNDGDDVIDLDDSNSQLVSALSGFNNCDVLLDYLHAEGVNRVGPYGFDMHNWGGVPWMAVDDMTRDGIAEPAMADSATESGPALVEGVDFSGTNVQEAGVDEADIVKTDGEHIYLIASNQLIVVDANDRVVIGTVDLPNSHRSELFLNDGELLLVASAWNEAKAEPTIEEDNAAATSEPAADIADTRLAFGSNTVRVTRISVNAAGQPSLGDTVIVDGDYVSSRAVDGTARIVIRSNPQQNFEFVYPQGDNGEDVATESNKDAIRRSTLEDWLPSYVARNADGDTLTRGLLTDCRSMHAPTEFSGFGVLTVLSVPVAGDITNVDSTGVLAPGDTVYGSTEALYVATQAWPVVSELDTEEDWNTAWDNRVTNIHRFGLSDTGAAYTASGSVPGDVRSQFSFSEHDGHLRVITTTGDPWNETSETFVRVLRETDGELIEVGSVGDMGNGEAVQSVRFVGDVGYVVTFRQIDPFYTLDLSDPENPRVVGELKIPGFSSYLHPIGNGRVLGVGADADLDGRVTGSKVSIFDVSDPANPLEVSTWQAPDGWNNVGWEHRSFLWWEAEQLAVVPLEIITEEEHWAGAVVLRADGNELVEVGRIEHQETPVERGVTDCDVATLDDFGLEPAERPQRQPVPVEPDAAAATDMDPADDGGESVSVSADELQPVEPPPPGDELEWMLRDSLEDERALILLCGDGDIPTASGYECFGQSWIQEQAAEAGIEIAEGELLVSCWDEQRRLPVIARSMVINSDELWTLSGSGSYLSPSNSVRLQLNDLSSLELLDSFEEL